MTTLAAVPPVDEREPEDGPETLKQIVDRYLDHDIASNPRALAEAILHDEPDLLGDRLPLDTRVSMLRDAVSRLAGHPRRRQLGTHRLAVEGGPGTMIRIAAAGGAYWDTRWQVGATWKQTRELTKTDLEILVRDRNQRRQEIVAQMRWLLACLDLCRQHKIDRLGQLEDRQIDLPTLEIPEHEL